jgi:gamma-glutamyltranspeptidase/glutathione hydrolase
VAQKQFFPIFAACLLATCSTVSSVKEVVTGHEPKPGELITGYVGGAAGDEPHAVLAARDVLAHGGNAADAATALGFMLSVTLPSRAGLGAGGACLAYAPDIGSANGGAPEAILFLPKEGGGAGDRPAAVPMLARGLYLLSARYGTRPIAEMMAPAEQAARLGLPVSRAFARDAALVAGPLAADPLAASLFVPNGQPIAEGTMLVQPDLAGTLAQIRTVGVGDMYQGLLAHKFAEDSGLVGGGITIDAMRAAVPMLAAPATQPAGSDIAAFLPAAADQGAGAAAFAGNASQNTGARPASTSFVVTDRHGGAVACSLSMGNLFGTGRILPGTGVVLAASPRAKPMALFEAAIVYNSNLHAFRAMAAASGQENAPTALATSLQAALAGTIAASGHANVASCPQYLPGNENSCRIASGTGLATGG